MRLICPNCDAQYEVDDAAIPAVGRDVQCSSCGHGWFQTHPDADDARAAESALHDAPVAVASPAMPPPIPEMDDAPAPPTRQIDDAVLAVLREEAEREMIARRLDAEPAFEVQADLGIDNMAAAGPSRTASERHIALMKGEQPPEQFPEPPPEPPETKRELTRREMLPDIEEINSSLRPGDVAVDADGETFEIAARPATRSGFRSGFVLMVVLAVAVIALYVMAPQIAERLPAAKPALDSYVATVDTARAWLDTTTRGIVDSLQGLAGRDTPAP